MSENTLYGQRDVNRKMLRNVSHAKIWNANGH